MLFCLQLHYTSLQNLTFLGVQKVWDLILGKLRSLSLKLALVFMEQVKFCCNRYPFFIIYSLSLLTKKIDIKSIFVSIFYKLVLIVHLCNLQTVQKREFEKKTIFK